MASTAVFALLSALLAVASAFPTGYESFGLEHYEEKPLYEHSEVHHEEPVSYSYKYGVHDVHTGDIKSASENRHGDLVSGEYQLLQPDGITRIVKYTADKHNGFNAEVILHHGHGYGHGLP